MILSYLWMIAKINELNKRIQSTIKNPDMPPSTFRHKLNQKMYLELRKIKKKFSVFAVLEIVAYLYMYSSHTLF